MLFEKYQTVRTQLIGQRLKGMVNEPLFQRSYTICLKCAKALDDAVWESNLQTLLKDS